MANSLEFSVESFFIALFQADSRSAGKTLAHFNSEETAAANSIVFEAKQGEKNLAGDGGYLTEMVITYRTPIGTSEAEQDQGAALIHSVVYESTISSVTRAALATTAGLSGLIIKDEASGERENTSDLRKRSVTLPLVAKLA